MFYLIKTIVEIMQIPILFVDIDGTLTTTNSGKTFKQSPDDINPLPGSQKAITHFANRGYKIFGVSNQGGCDTINPKTGSPYKSIEDTIAEMQNTLALYSEIESIAFCPSIAGSNFCIVMSDGCVKDLESQLFKTQRHRKPDTGMLDALIIHHINKQAFTNWNLVNKKQSLIVGDRDDDKQLASNADIPFMWSDEWRFKYGSF